MTVKELVSVGVAALGLGIGGGAMVAQATQEPLEDRIAESLCVASNVRIGVARAKAEEWCEERKTKLARNVDNAVKLVAKAIEQKRPEDEQVALDELQRQAISKARQDMYGRLRDENIRRKEMGLVPLPPGASIDGSGEWEPARQLPGRENMP